MIWNKTVLAIIPARSGSKRLPGKNTRLFDDKPLIEWTIEAAFQSRYIDNVIISSDDPYEIKKEYKDRVWFILRPKELASDTANITDELLRLAKQYDYDIIVLLQPTSPLRVATDIDTSIEKLAEHDSVISVASDTPWMYKLNGAIYVTYREKLQQYKGFKGKTYLYVMPKHRSIDIDDEYDFKVAEYLSKEYR